MGTTDSWSDDLVLGIDELDEEHRGLIRWLDRFDDLVANGDRWLLVYNALVELSQTAQLHFAVEESVMRISAYPRLAEHATEHAEFLVRVKVLTRESLLHDVGDEAADFIRDWLFDHIMRSDRDYVDGLQRRLEPLRQLLATGSGT